MDVIQGILARLWCSSGVVILIGVFCLLIMWIEKEKKTETIAVACLCVLLGVGVGIWYSYALLNPDTQIVSGTFVYDQKKTDAMPPLPLTREYIFEDEQGQRIDLYMDSFTKKQVFPETLAPGESYIITYEERTDLILKIAE